MNKLTDRPSNNLFFRLPLEPGTVKLTLKTLNIHSEFRRPAKPYLRINIRKIYFRNEVLTIGIKLQDEIEERVFIRVKQTELLISCTVDTDGTYLSRYAYFALIELMFVNDFYNFEKFYWPGFFDPKTGKSKYLDVINDRQGMDISLKSKYSKFYKPGHKLVFPGKDDEIIERACLQREEVNIDLENASTIGYCLADTNLHSLHSNHFPFLVPYLALLNNSKDAVKTFQTFLINHETEMLPNFTPLQEQLNKICFNMLEIASVKSYRYRSSAEEIEAIKAENSQRAIHLFKLWGQAIALLNSQLYTHYHFTHGMSNVSGKPRKKNMEPCKFSMKTPKICFLRVDKGDYYEMQLQFNINNRRLIPYEYNTAFFLRSKTEPMTFYLLQNVSDYHIVSFFARHGFKLSVLKSHYKNDLKNFVDQLAASYEFTIL